MPHAEEKREGPYSTRRGRMSPAGRELLAHSLPRYEVASDSAVDWAGVFGRDAPLVVEVGSGSGEHVVGCALARPEHDHVAIELYPPGIRNTVRALDREEIGNVRLVRVPARRALETMFADGSVGAVHALFPDPWPKRRHRKRRLVDRGFMALVARKLAPGGAFRSATDWEDYARDIRRAAAEAGLVVCEDPPARPVITRFEARAAREGRRVEEILCRLPSGQGGGPPATAAS